MGLSLYLPYLLPHSQEGPPSYKPPTPKAKLEEPEMVSTSPGAQAALTTTLIFPHCGRGWGGLVGRGWLWGAS